MVKGSSRKEKIQIITTFFLMTLLAVLAFTFLANAYAYELQVHVSGKANLTDEDGDPYVVVYPGEEINLLAQRIEYFGSHKNTIDIYSHNLVWWEDGEQVTRFKETNGIVTKYYVPQGTWEFIDIEAKHYKYENIGWLRLINGSNQDMGYYNNDEQYYDDEEYEDPEYYYEVADHYYRTEIVHFPVVREWGYDFYMLPLDYVPYRYGVIYPAPWGLRYRPDRFRFRWEWAPAYYGCVVWHPGYGRYLYYWDRSVRVTGISLQIDLFYTSIDIGFFHYNSYYDNIYDIAYGRGFRDGYRAGSRFWDNSPHIVTVVPRDRFFGHGIGNVRRKEVKVRTVRDIFDGRKGRRDDFYTNLSKDKANTREKRREYRNAFDNEVLATTGKDPKTRIGGNTNPAMKRPTQGTSKTPQTNTYGKGKVTKRKFGSSSNPGVNGTSKNTGNTGGGTYSPGKTKSGSTGSSRGSTYAPPKTKSGSTGSSRGSTYAPPKTKSGSTGSSRGSTYAPPKTESGSTGSSRGSTYTPPKTESGSTGSSRGSTYTPPKTKSGSTGSSRGSTYSPPKTKSGSTGSSRGSTYTPPKTKSGSTGSSRGNTYSPPKTKSGSSGSTKSSSGSVKSSGPSKPSTGNSSKSGSVKSSSGSSKSSTGGKSSSGKSSSGKSSSGSKSEKKKKG